MLPISGRLIGDFCIILPLREWLIGKSFDIGANW
jgi:hypothetical protein